MAIQNCRFRLRTSRTKYKYLKMNKLTKKRCPKHCPKLSEVVRNRFSISDNFGQDYKLKSLKDRSVRLSEVSDMVLATFFLN